MTKAVLLAGQIDQQNSRKVLPAKMRTSNKYRLVAARQKAKRID